MIDPTVFIAPGVQIIGDVTIGPDSSIWYGTVIRADGDQVVIGQGCNIQDASTVHVSRGYPVILEDHVSIAHGVILHGCHIEQGAVVGIGAIVLDGARIGDHSFVGAGSLVLENAVIPPRSLVMGHPAKVVRTLSDQEITRYGQIAKGYVHQARQRRNGAGK